MENTEAALRYRVDMLDRNQAALRSDMKDGFDKVGKSIDTIVDKLSSAQRPNYMIGVAVASLCVTMIGGFITMVKGPSDARIDRLEISATQHGAVMPQLMTKEDYRTERDRNFNIISKEMERIEKHSDEGDARFEAYRNRHEVSRDAK